MRLATLLAAAAVTGVAASPLDLTATVNIGGLIGVDLTAANFYGAPIPPWLPNHVPGWYYGNNPFPPLPGLPCLTGLLCKLLELFPFLLQCPKPPQVPPPPPSDGYHRTFQNLTGATQASDYQTFGLVDTVADCKAMCNSIAGCNFVNTYHDVNGKGGSPLLTCSLFTKCHDASDAINRGGQTQPDGSVNFIINSDGWCKDGAPDPVPAQSS